jgi:hypothetical protein
LRTAMHDRDFLGAAGHFAEPIEQFILIRMA